MIFKGQGFYLTDYKKSAGTGGPKKTEETKKEGGGTGTKTDSGPTASGTDSKGTSKP
jgi:predicted nucleic acid-binding Zn ribbon protein